MGGGQDNTAMKIDRFGNLKYYYINSYGCIADFKKVETKDGIRYLMFTTVSSIHSTHGCSQSVCYVVMDENYHEINRLFMKKSDIVPTDTYQVDQYDCLYLSDNGYHLITYMDKYNIPAQSHIRNMVRWFLQQSFKVYMTEKYSLSGTAKNFLSCMDFLQF